MSKYVQFVFVCSIYDSTFHSGQPLLIHYHLHHITRHYLCFFNTQFITEQLAAKKPPLPRRF